MRYALLLLMLTFAFPSVAQYAILQDKDGFVNLREFASAKSKIIKKISTNEIVYVSNKGNDDTDWSVVDFTDKTGELLTGYLHNSRIKFLESYESIPSINGDEGE